MSQRQFERWQNRWQGLRRSIKAEIINIAGPDAPTLELPPGTDPVGILGKRSIRLQDVQKFAQSIEDSSADQKDKHFKAVTYLALNLLLRYTGERFEYLNEGFFNQEKHKLEWSIELPPAYILHSLLKLASRDFSMLTKIYGQRQNEAWRGHLEAADYLADLALDPAIKAGLVPNAQIITYFQKETSIKIIPYASMALIGIPYASLYNPADLLSIPHEVGHHIYVNGQFKDTPEGATKILSQELARQVAEYPYWVRQWTEEIFADVYGAIIAGPIAALSAQTVIDEKSPAERVRDDGEHPVDLVRPLVYQYILKKVNEMPLEPGAENIESDVADPVLVEQVIHALEARWKQVNFGLPKQFRPAISLLGLNEEVPDGFIKEEEAGRKLRQLIANSDNIVPLRNLLEEGDRRRKATKEARATELEILDPEVFFPFGDWGNLQNDQTRGRDPIADPEVMFDKFERLFRRKFEAASLGIQDETDDQKEAALKFDILRETEPYSTHILYSLNHGSDIQIPTGIWRLLRDDWGERGPRTLGGGGGMGGG